MIERDSERDYRVKYNFEADWKKKNSTLCGAEENYLVLQLQRVEIFRVEDLAIGFCGKVVFISRDIIVC